jgi:enoyl-CoA hydratase
VTLNRPKALNALCQELADELMAALNKLDRDDDVHVIVITGSKKAFAGKWMHTLDPLRLIVVIAGADIKEMCDKNIVEMRHPDQTLQVLDGVTKIQKPIIAGTCRLKAMTRV